MEKSRLNLSKIVGIYLLVIAFFIIIVTIAFSGFFDRVGDIRADDTEKEVEAWVEEAKNAQSFDVNSFPEKADYVIEKNEKWVDSKITNCTTEDMQQGINCLKSYNMNHYLEKQEVFISESLSDETIYIHYSMKVKGEWAVVIAFISAYILVILIPSVILIRRLRKMIYTLAEEKWRKEYEIKREMAQIAHDLKTPLTIIRGNADLLLEKDQDEESIESIQAIIRNAEKIARSVLDILEKQPID